MRLRTRIQAPERFEDEEFSSFAGSDATRPAFPKLLADSTVTFDPHLPPAAFPSLELRPASQLTSDSSNVMNIDRPVSGTSVSILIRTKMDEQQRTAFPASISGMNGVPGPEPAFMDELETSEEEGYGSSLTKDPPSACASRPVTWTQLAPSLQVEIFENLCRSEYGSGALGVLGLTREEAEEVCRHCYRRDKQMFVEEEGTHELQRAQLNAILRTDHSSKIGFDSWRTHVAYTRRHLPNILSSNNPSRIDYLICTVDQSALARTYLAECAIDISVLGEWAFNTPSRSFEQGPASQSVNGDSHDSGYTSAVTERRGEQGNSSQQPQKGAALSMVSKNARKEEKLLRTSLKAPIADTENVAPTRCRSGPHVMAATQADAFSPISPDASSPASSMSLRARGTLRNEKYDAAIAAMRTRGGGFDDSDNSYEEDNDVGHLQSTTLLKINPPKPPHKPGEAFDRHARPSPGQRAIMLKISPGGLAKIRKAKATKNYTGMQSLPDPTIPATTTISYQSFPMTPQHIVSQAHHLLPVAREALNFHEGRELNPFQLKLLEIQRGARGLDTPPASSGVQQQPRDFKSVSPPKRPKLNHSQEKSMVESEENVDMQAPELPAQSQRKDSTYYQISPDWSPISRRNSEVSIPQTNTVSFASGFPNMTVPYNESQNSGAQATPSEAQVSFVPTRPRRPARPVPHYVKLSVAEIGSPMGVSGSSRDNATVTIPSTSFHVTELAEDPRRLSDPRLTPYVGADFSDLVAAKVNPSHVSDPPHAPQTSPSRQLPEDQAGTGSTSPSSAAGVAHLATSPSSISDAELSQTNALPSSFQRKSATEAISSQATTSGSVQHSLKTSANYAVGEKGAQIKAKQAPKEPKAAGTEAGLPNMPKGPARGVKRGPYKKTLKRQAEEAAVAAAAMAGLSTGQSSDGSNIIGEGTYVSNADEPSQPTRPPQLAAHALMPPEEGKAPVTEDSFLEPSLATKNSAPAALKIKEKLEAALVAVVDKAGSENIVVSAKETTSHPGPPKSTPKAKKAVSEGGDNEESGSVMSESITSDSSVDPTAKQIAIAKSKFKKVAVDRAKVAARELQAKVPAAKKSTVKDTQKGADNQKTTPQSAAKQEDMALLNKATPKSNEAAVTKKGSTSTDTATPTSKQAAVMKNSVLPKPKATPKPQKPAIDNEDSTSERKKPGPKPKEASVDGESSISRSQKSKSLSRELSNLSDEPKPKFRDFRGNQWKNADGSPRLNDDGTPKILSGPRAKEKSVDG